ncbi:hypothetical protein [Roseateles sp.]|uniref:hypothetical protein n=1 Tax=Roseateles sp. TaxID=1971397 RepID=UPI003BA74629
MHAKFDSVKTRIANIHEALQYVKANAEQMPKVDRWATLMRYICQRIVSGIATNPTLKHLEAPG